MLSSEDLDWRTVMTAYDARRLTEQAFDFGKSDDRRHRTLDKHTLIGRSFIRFVSSIFKCELCAEMRESGKREVSVYRVLGHLNTINCMSYGSSSALSETSENRRNLSGLFEVDVPREPLSGTEACDLMRLTEPKG